ncbi:MAG: hypothetical protein KGI69_01225 [Patescibacteria group bacterium]|nr:hypothetical protein [Patescibacteria group bacterium]
MKKRVLMSVTNKTGLVEFARGLIATGDWEIVSTGGTARALEGSGVPCTLVEEVTGFPEMMDGRVKTLHPMIHGGILADRDKPAHMEAAAQHGIVPIDMVVVNLYDFSAKPSVEQIDIGGPSLIRGAAKNFHHVAVVVDPEDYDDLLIEIAADGTVSEQTRHYLAGKAFRATAAYDLVIATEFAKHEDAGTMIPLGTH